MVTEKTSSAIQRTTQIIYDINYFTNNSGKAGYSDYTQVQKFMSGIADDIEATYGSVNGLRVLDVGCAFGYMTNELDSRGAEITGLDSSNYAITQAQTLFPTLEFIEEDIANQGRRNNYYDMIVGLGIIDTMVSQLDMDNALDELNRVGKNNADVYILTSEDSEWYSVRTEFNWLSSLSNAFGGLWVVQDVGHLPLMYDWRIIKAG